MEICGGMRAIFRYPGSKWSIAEWIISHFPAGYEKMVYLEPFVGSGAVFFSKIPGTVETINDLDGDIVNLFRVLREQSEELKRALELTPYAREEYNLAFEPCDDPVEKARRYMVKTTQAIGIKKGKGWRVCRQTDVGGNASKWGGAPELLEEIASRLRANPDHHVQIEHRDALKLISMFNSPDVLMYLDPPYLSDTRKSGAVYAHEMSEQGHRELLELIAQSKAKIIISGYNSGLYNTMLSGWNKDEKQVVVQSGADATEVIWMNYEPPLRQFSIFEEGENGGSELV